MTKLPLQILSSSKFRSTTDAIGPFNKSPALQLTMESLSSIDASMRARVAALIAALRTARLGQLYIRWR